jgi:hypothetical protein
MDIIIIHNLKVGNRNGKKSFGLPLYAVSAQLFLALFNTFWGQLRAPSNFIVVKYSKCSRAGF